MIKIDKIQLHNFRFFIDEEEHNSFELNGYNMLLYGENGSGKSSLYKAFEFLAQRDIEEKKFLESKNIFKDGDVSLFFKLNNGKDIVIDVENLINRDKYIDGLSMYKPMLEYKNLLKIHYEIDKSRDEINIYEMLRDAFKEYPIDNNQLLSDIKNPDNYFELLENILNSTILDKVNRYIVKFDKYFYIKKFFFDKEFTDDGKVEFIVNIKIDFMNKNIDYYHNFLNEAKLSALAMAIYFSIIRDISNNIENNGLKLLILDDLLISLDMSNRLSLIEIIKNIREGL